MATLENSPFGRTIKTGGSTATSILNDLSHGYLSFLNQKKTVGLTTAQDKMCTGRGCSIWRIVQSAIGIFVGVSSAIVFYYMYNNGQAASWALASGVFAAAALHLAVILHKENVHEWYTIGHLWQIQFLGVVLTLASLGAFGWYIFITIYYHIPMLPVDKSSIVTSVWVGMTAKWTFLMWYFAKLGVQRHQYVAIDDNEFA